MINLMLRIAAAAVTGVILCSVLKKHTPELSFLLAIAAGIYCLGAGIGALAGAAAVLRDLFELTGLDEALLTPVAKVVLISLVTRITSELCRGAGEGGIAAFVETAGAALALGVSLPMIRAMTVLMEALLA